MDFWFWYTPKMSSCISFYNLFHNLNFNLQHDYTLVTYFSFPKIGLRPIMTDARALLTCWFGSATSSLTNGRMEFIMMPSCWNWSKFWQKSLTLFAAAARTSASVSFNSDWKEGTKSVLVISGPTAFWSCQHVTGSI